MAAHETQQARATRSLEADLSVVMTTCDGAAFVAEQLRSILSQTVSPRELIILDDASTDDTLAIVGDVLSTTNIPTRIVRNPKRLGVVRNVEKGVRLVRSPLIALADQDDVWLSDKIEQTAAPFDADPSLQLVFTNARLIDQRGEMLPATLWERVGFRRRRRMKWARDPLAVVLQQEIATGATMVLRTDAALAAMPYSTCRIHDSWLVLYLLMTDQKVTAMQAPTIQYRVHGNNQAGVAPARQRARLSRFQAERQLHEARVAQFDELEARLATVPRLGHVEALRAARRHSLMRAQLPDSRLRRVPAIAKLAATGGYGTWEAPRRVVHDLLAVAARQT